MEKICTHALVCAYKCVTGFTVKCSLTCAGVRLLGVDLQEDECGEEQQPAQGPIWSLPHRGPSAPRGRVQDATAPPDP